MTGLKHAIASLAALALIAPPAGAADLSPAHWPEGRLAQAEAREAAVWPAAPRKLAGGQGSVSATASPIAVEAGMAALRQGGTAADAAIAVSLTQVATMAGANVSYAGVMQLLYFEARTGRIYALDGGWNSWRGERSPETIPAADLSLITGDHRDTATPQAGRKTLVPGFMAGMEAAHRRFGKLAWADLFAPAIWYAGRGVPVTPLLAAYFPLAERNLAQTPEGRAFLHPDGQGFPKGRLQTPGLAATLRAVAANGAREMYKGAWARAYVAAVKGAGGAATLADMAAYKPRWRRPLDYRYGNVTLYAPGEPNYGGCAILEALNLLDHHQPRLASLTGPAGFAAIARVTRAGMLAAYNPANAEIEKRATGLGGSCRARLTPAFGVAGAANLDALLAGQPGRESTHHSASVVVVDRWGNVAALVHSSNTPLWGDTGLIVGGIALPTPAGIFQGQLAGRKPGTRLPTEIAPLLALRHNKPILGVAGIGVSLMPETVRLVSRIVAGGDPGAALAAPAMLSPYAELAATGPGRDELVPAGAWPQAFRDELKRLGVPTREVDAARTMAYRGTLAFALLGPNVRQAFEAPGVIVFGDAY